MALHCLNKLRRLFAHDPYELPVEEESNKTLNYSEFHMQCIIVFYFFAFITQWNTVPKHD